MLTTMLMLFLLGSGLLGGSLATPAEVETIGEAVEQVVNNSETAVDARRIFDELGKEAEVFDRIFIDSGDKLRDLYLDHESQAWQMQRSLELLNLEWYQSQHRGLKLRDQLLETMTADEWAVVFAP